MTSLVPLSNLETLSLDEFTEALKPLFESAPVLARVVYASRPFATYAALIDRAEVLARQMGDADQVAVVNAHPRIGAPVAQLSASSAREQGGSEDPRVLAELARLNDDYEARFGFRFVVFVNRRPRSAIVEILRDRLHNTRADELRTALGEMFAIARDRLTTLST